MQGVGRSLARKALLSAPEAFTTVNSMVQLQNSSPSGSTKHRLVPIRNLLSAIRCANLPRSSSSRGRIYQGSRYPRFRLNVAKQGYRHTLPRISTPQLDLGKRVRQRGPRTNRRLDPTECHAFEPRCESIQGLQGPQICSAGTEHAPSTQRFARL